MKSSSAVTTDEIGTMARGKYTFVIRCWLPSRLLPAVVIAFAKSSQGRSPQV